jgi:hypothetical protein
MHRKLSMAIGIVQYGVKRFSKGVQNQEGMECIEG